MNKPTPKLYPTTIGFDITELSFIAEISTLGSMMYARVADPRQICVIRLIT